MPKFLDVHPMKGFDEETLKKTIAELPDEFGVTAENFLFNLEADRLYYILKAPNKESIWTSWIYKTITRNMELYVNGLWK
ncbi:MAG: hypothetical protein WA421_15410 [Nitrososphaeraceae archaeon]